jgi:hypothetical protein
MTKVEFDYFRRHQFCDNSNCSYYCQSDAGNLKIKSLAKGRVYCVNCKVPFSVRKGTMFFGLRTNMDKIARVLGLLASGIGVNAVCRENDVTADSLRDWVLLAARHVNEFSVFLEQDMHLDQVQIDEFWSFIRKKKNT